MSNKNSIVFKELSEDEAAIYLFWCAIIADGIVQESEIKEAKYRANLHLASLGLSSASEKYAQLQKLINDFPKDFTKLDYPITSENIKVLGSKIIILENRMSVLHAIVAICFSDNDFHVEEKSIVGILNDLWEF